MAVLFFVWTSIFFLFGNVVFHSGFTYYAFNDPDDVNTGRILKSSSIAFALTGIYFVTL